MNILVFHQRFQVPPSSHHRLQHPHHHHIIQASWIRDSPSGGLCGRGRVLEWCDGPRWVRSGPFGWVWWGRVGWGGVGGVVLFFFLIQTDNQLSRLLW